MSLRQNRQRCGSLQRQDVVAKAKTSGNRLEFLGNVQDRQPGTAERSKVDHPPASGAPNGEAVSKPNPRAVA